LMPSRAFISLGCGSGRDISPIFAW
jgi:hypothetical protein